MMVPGLSVVGKREFGLETMIASVVFIAMVDSGCKPVFVHIGQWTGVYFPNGKQYLV